MTLNAFLNEAVFWGVFLLVGFLVREYCKPLQKLFIPSSIVGGLIALVLGEQLLGLVSVPASFSSYAGVFVRIIMTAPIFGVILNKDKIISYLDYHVLNMLNYSFQLAAGVALGYIFSTIWTDLPIGWGVQGVFSFVGGHGTAATAGAVFEEHGVMGNTTIGMVLSTLGVIVAMIIGMVIINIGARKGWCSYVKEPAKQPDWYYRGALPAERQLSIGTQKTTGLSVNALALQLAWILLAIFIGGKVVGLIGLVWPGISMMPQMIYGAIGGFILWPVLCKIKFDKYVDSKTMNQIGGLSLDLLVLGAVATLDIGIVVTFFVPLLLFALIIQGITVVITFWGAKKMCQTDWFEKAICAFGYSTGNAGTGLALLRACDPNNESSVTEAVGVNAGLISWVNLFVPILPVTLLSGIGFAVGLGAIEFIVFFIIGFVFLARYKKKKGSLA